MRTHLTRFLRPLVPALLLAAAALSAPPARAQQKPKAPQWAYAFDLACRKLGEAEFTKDTQKFGVEVFRDANNGVGVYIAQTGSLALAADFENVKVPVRDSKAPEWVAGLDVKVRPASEVDFDKAKTYSMEVFRDGNSGNWLAITDKGNLAAAPAKTAGAGGLKAPQWLHSMDLRCRKAGQKEWTKDTPSFGVEVYRDQTTGNLLYITDTGSVALVSGVEGPAPGAKDRAPYWLHGLDLHVRKHGEKDFTKATTKIGVEVFRDGNNGCLILLTEAGNIAVVPGKKDLKAPTPAPRDPQFSHGLDLSCRKTGERDFTDKTRTFGIEVFREVNLGLVVYVCETGSIAAVAQK